jgi:hypothetical protein
MMPGENPRNMPVAHGTTVSYRSANRRAEFQHSQHELRAVQVRERLMGNLAQSHLSNSLQGRPQPHGRRSPHGRDGFRPRHTTFENTVRVIAKAGSNHAKHTSGQRN